MQNNANIHSSKGALGTLFKAKFGLGGTSSSASARAENQQFKASAQRTFEQLKGALPPPQTPERGSYPSPLQQNLLVASRMPPTDTPPSTWRSYRSAFNEQRSFLPIERRQGSSLASYSVHLIRLTYAKLTRFMANRSINAMERRVATMPLTKPEKTRLCQALKNQVIDMANQKTTKFPESLTPKKVYLIPLIIGVVFLILLPLPTLIFGLALGAIATARQAYNAHIDFEAVAGIDAMDRKLIDLGMARSYHAQRDDQRNAQRLSDLNSNQDYELTDGPFYEISLD